MSRVKIFVLALGLMLIMPLLPARANSQVPGNLSFCGEKVEVNDPVTYESLDQNLILLSEARSRVFLAMRRAGRYEDMVRRALSDAGAPEDLIYIPYALTGFDPEYNSGGRGMWRLKESDARVMGLKVDSTIDERLDPVASTTASIARLKQLKSSFGSWTAAAAAFVTGESVVQSAMAESGSRNFYDLFLPGGQDQQLTMVLAGKVIFQNPAAFGYRLSGTAWPTFSGKRVLVSQPAGVRSLASQYGLDYKSFRDINPHLIADTAPAGATVNLP